MALHHRRLCSSDSRISCCQEERPWNRYRRLISVIWCCYDYKMRSLNPHAVYVFALLAEIKGFTHVARVLTCRAVNLNLQRLEKTSWTARSVCSRHLALLSRTSCRSCTRPTPNECARAHRSRLMPDHDHGEFALPIYGSEHQCDALQVRREAPSNQGAPKFGRAFRKSVLKCEHGLPPWLCSYNNAYR